MYISNIVKSFDNVTWEETLDSIKRLNTPQQSLIQKKGLLHKETVKTTVLTVCEQVKP